jgi:hypothetical protein
MRVTILYGVRPYGRVFGCGSTALATQFFHIWYLPILPLGGVIALSSTESLPTRLRWDSVIVGYLRTWAPLVAIGLLAWTLALPSAARNDLAMTSGPLALVCAVSAGLAWRYGRLSNEQKAQQLVYGEHFDYPVDVAWLGATETSVLLARIQDFLAKNQASMIAPADRTHAERKLWALKFTARRVQTKWARPGRLSAESRAIWDDLQKRYPDYVESAKVL